MTSSAVQPTAKLLNILYACANGRLPWGQPWDRFLPLCEGSETGEDRYILCCEHTLTRQESAQLLGAGIMISGREDRFGRPTLTISKAGREYLLQHMNMVEFDG